MSAAMRTLIIMSPILVMGSALSAPTSKTAGKFTSRTEATNVTIMRLMAAEPVRGLLHVP